MCLTQVLNLLDCLRDCDESKIGDIATNIKRELVATPASGLRIMEQPSEDGCYSLAHFIDRVVQRRGGQTYGYQSAYIRATEESDHPATELMISKWKRSGRVPAEYVQQIDLLVFVKPTRETRPRRVWSMGETDYLRAMYDDDPSASNSAFAHKCSSQFGRIITINAIKGQLYRIKHPAEVELVDC